MIFCKDFKIPHNSFQTKEGLYEGFPHFLEIV